MPLNQRYLLPNLPRPDRHRGVGSRSELLQRREKNPLKAGVVAVLLLDVGYAPVCGRDEEGDVAGVKVRDTILLSLQNQDWASCINPRSLVHKLGLDPLN